MSSNQNEPDGNNAEKTPLLSQGTNREYTRIRSPLLSQGAGPMLINDATLATPGESEALAPDVEEGVDASIGDQERTDPRSLTEKTLEVGAQALKGGSVAVRSLVCRGQVQDAMTYHMDDLCNWTSLTLITYTVFHRRTLWMTGAKIFALAMVVALFTVLTLPDPAQINTASFTAICNFLRVFVGLLLGFFMSASVSRWWDCAQGFLDLFTVIRVMQHDLQSFGVPEEHTVDILRFGYTSAWILSKQLRVEAISSERQRKAKQEIWTSLERGIGIDKRFGTLTADELKVLQDVGDPAGALWMWVGSYLGHLSELGFIPPMASPLYGRMLGLSERGFDAIRTTRSSVVLQAPYIYVHMLAALVHINNIVNAFSFGLTMGATVATFLVYVNTHLWGVNHGHATSQNLTKDLQDLLVSFVFSCFGPFIYQALLECSVAIAQPFSNEDAVVPTQRLLALLAQDLKDGLVINDRVAWKKPCFKK